MLLQLKYIWENLFLSFTSILRILFLSKFNIRLKKGTNYDSCVILGNGPSLNQFIKEQSDFLSGKATLCVNYFARSKEEYLKFKPDYYVINAPEFWQKEEKEGWQEERMEIFQIIAALTQADIKLFVPKMAKRHKKWKENLEKNEHISIIYFNNIPIEGFRFLTHWAYKSNLGMPRPHNVLIPSILFMINLRYTELYIVGAEHSWLKELFVTNENKVLLSQKHFYHADKNEEKTEFNTGKARPMYLGATKKERKLHEVLEKFFYAFRSYWELKDYAAYRGTEIFNLTKDSYIDAFTKRQL